MSTTAVKAARSYWDRRAHIYTEIRQRKEWFKEVDQRILNLIDMQPQATILDLGTGPASFATKVAKNNRTMNIVGLDISKRSLNIAKINIKKEKLENQIHLITATADRLPFRKNTFNSITSVLTIHHLPTLRMEKAFKEIFRVIKPKGRFAMAEDWASEPRSYFQRIIYALRKILMRTEIEEYHTKYYEYVSMIERNGLKIFAVEFHPRQVDLSRFESLTSPRARKLLERAEKTDQRQQTIDTTFIGAVKPAQQRRA